MFDRKDMVDAAIKARQLTSTDKTRQDQLLEQETTMTRTSSMIISGLSFGSCAETQPSTL